MPSKYAMNKYPQVNINDGGFRKSLDETRRLSFDKGAVAALREVATQFKGRQIWPGDLLEIADRWERGDYDV